MMWKFLIIGDSHIPTRASSIPKRIESHILNNEYYMVLCTGDLVDKSVLDFLNSIAPTKVVVGNMDYLDLPEYEKMEIEGIKIGMAHGHQVRPRGDIRKLAKLAYSLDVDILVTGHTHVPLVKKVIIEGREILILNPGSCTGVWSGGGGSLIPSFMELVISKERSACVTLYELKGLTLTKTEYSLSI